MLFFENLNRDFGTLGIGIVQIGLQIRTRRPRIKLYANVGKFGCIISPKNNQLACFFLSPCTNNTSMGAISTKWNTNRGAILREIFAYFFPY